MIREDVTTDSAGIGDQGGYNDGDTRLPFIFPSFQSWMRMSGQEKKRCGKQVKNKRKGIRKGDSKTSFVSF